MGCRLRNLMIAAAAGLLCGGAAAPSSYDVAVKIAFTPWAARYLAQRPQKLVVYALYSGEPIPSRLRSVDREEGTITIGEHSMTIPARPATIRLTGATINRQRLPWIKRLDVEVGADLEVWEERWKVECKPAGNSASGALAAVQARGVTITCDRAPQY